MRIDERQLARYGEIVARLARPLADRAAVLWLMRLDAATFAALETACVTAMAQDAKAAEAFALAYAKAHQLLADDVAAPATIQNEPETPIERSAIATVETVAATVQSTAPVMITVNDAAATPTLTSERDAPPRPGPKRR